MTELRQALRERGYPYVLGVSPELTVWTEAVAPEELPYRGRGRRPTWKGVLPKPFKLPEVAHGLPSAAWREITWRQGTKGPMQGRFAAIRVQPSPGY